MRNMLTCVANGLGMVASQINIQPNYVYAELHHSDPQEGALMTAFVPLLWPPPVIQGPMKCTDYPELYAPLMDPFGIQEGNIYHQFDKRIKDATTLDSSRLEPSSATLSPSPSVDEAG